MFGMGVSVALAAGAKGDKCGSQGTPPTSGGNWYEECNQLAADCIGAGNRFVPKTYNPSGGVDGGECV